MPRAGISIPEAKRTFEIETANLKPFSWGIERGLFSFAKENPPFETPRERLDIASEQLEELGCLPIALP